MGNPMTPERWQLLRRLLDQAWELPEDRRLEFLDSACQGDEELRREAGSLLHAADGAGTFLDDPALRQVSGSFAATAGRVGDAATRTRVGAYEIVGEIGHGGMGTVYLGRRSEGGFAQDVAIKLVRPGLDNDFIRRRFLAERQILAGLEHPNIARLYDGGTTEDGLPYFVMEHIEGDTLLAFCDSRRLPLVERLRLFERVCGAVQYAHQRLVVHRDLKPSNILVTAEGVPKLLDFGLAKLLHRDAAAAETANLTELGLRLMTPEYASPEQVRGEAVTTASDIYSLGVLLFELLTGQRPYRLGSRRQEEIERVVCGTPPTRPSTVVSRAETLPATDGAARLTPEELSASRGVTPARLRRSLSGDLDNIVLKALRKEPERRYASVGQLAEDIRRHLAGRPVSARPDTLGYRANKFVRRHAWAVTAATVVAIALVGLVAFYTARLTRERDRARLEAEKATQVSGFLSSLFELSEPDRAKGAKLTARDLLDRGAATVEKDLTTQPEVQASMLGLIGNVYRQLGLYAPARPLLERSLAIRERRFGKEDVAVAESLRRLGVLQHLTGDEKTARPLLERALAIHEKVLGPGDLEVAQTLSDLANTVRATGDNAGAASIFRRAIKIEEQSGPADDPRLARLLNNFSILLLRTNQPAEAKSLLERALAIHEKNSGPDSASVAGTLQNLAWALRDTHDLPGAMAMQERALAIAEKIYGPESRQVAIGLNELGNVSSAMHDAGRARAYFERSARVFSAALGPDHPDGAWPLRGLANMLSRDGRFAEARPLYEHALAIRLKAYPAEHPDVADSFRALGRVELRLGDFSGAETHLRRALAIDRKILSPGDTNLAEALGALGDLLCQRGRRAEATPLLTEGRDILRAAKPPAPKQLDEAEALLRSCAPAGGS